MKGCSPNSKLFSRLKSVFLMFLDQYLGFCSRICLFDFLVDNVNIMWEYAKSAGDNTWPKFIFH